MLATLSRNQEIVEFIKRIFANGWQTLCGILTGLASIFAPVVPIVLTALCFIIVDLIFGYGVSRKFGSKHFESRKFWDTVIKFSITITLIGLGTIVDKFILMTYADLILAKIAAGMVIVAELISIMESVRALYPNAVLAKLLSKIIKSKAEKYLEIDMSDIIKDKENDTNTNIPNQ